MGPATPNPSSRARSSGPPLNEGRPGGAGNPGKVEGQYRLIPFTAQRRPARWGRQPTTNFFSLRLASMSAQRRPARWGRQPPRGCHVGTVTVPVAQRRPARWGRQPSEAMGCVSPNLRRSTKAGPVGPATLTLAGAFSGGDAVAQRRPARWGRQPVGRIHSVESSLRAQRRPARWGRQPCPTSTIGALRHMGNIGERAKGVEKQRLHLRWASVLKDHSRFADRYRTHGSPNSCDRGRPSVVRDSWIGPAKR